MLFRTVLVYVLLILVLRLMGKRQIGELQPSELVTTLLLSEIASAPITDDNIPVVYGIVPVVVVLSIEVITSYATTKLSIFKKIFNGKPSILINKGVIDLKELKKCRISVEELMGELRCKNVGSPAQVRYCLLEDNGKMSVILNRSDSPVVSSDINVVGSECGMARILVSDGKIDLKECSALGHNEQWVKKQLQKRKISDIALVLLLTCDDCDNLYIALK